MRTTYTAWVIALLTFCVCVNPKGAAAQEVKSKDQQVEDAIEKAKAYLWSQYHEERYWQDEDTPLVILALLEAGEDVMESRMKRAAEALAELTNDSKPERAAALAQLASHNRDKYRSAVYLAAKDLLTEKGTKLQDKASELGMDEAATVQAIFRVETEARIEIPKGYWKLADARWREAQRVDGSWDGKGWQGSDEAATATGLAVLSMASGMLEAEPWTPAKGNYEDKAVEKAVEWLGGRLARARLTPRQWCVVEDAALVTGRRAFGAFDWWAAGRDNLLGAQRKDGSWGGNPRETAWALLFLARGRVPIALCKLRYDGLWNTGPRDAANLGRWFGPEFCYPPLQWEVVDVSTAPATWHDASVLYVSMGAPPKFSDADIARLRAYVEQGGLIFTENAAEAPAIDEAVRQLSARIFPGRRMAALPGNHPIYGAHFPIQGGVVPLEGLSNGLRLLIVHSPKPFSPALHRRMWMTQEHVYQTTVNAIFYANNKSRLVRRDEWSWPTAKPFQAVATVKVARVKYAGDFDPEPLAWERFAILMGNRHKVKIEVSPPMAAGELDAKKWPVAAVTCTGEKPLTEADIPPLRAYVAAGGTLVADIAGGAEPAAAEVVRKLLNGIEPSQKFRRLLADHDLYTRPDAPIEKVQFTRALRGEIGQDKAPRLEGLTLNGRLAVIFTPDDLTAGLVGVQVYGIRGYQPESAFELMRNILLHAAGVKLEEKK